MRIFTLILSLILAAACIVLNALGYNGTLSFIQFLLITSAAEILLCLILGHFAYRTYANHKRAKGQAQELTNARAALQLKEKEATEAKSATTHAESQLASLQVDISDLQAKLAAAEDRATSAEERLHALAQPQAAGQNTQRMPSATAETANTDDPLNTTTLYNAPLA